MNDVEKLFNIKQLLENLMRRILTKSFIVKMYTCCIRGKSCQFIGKKRIRKRDTNI